MKEAKIGLTSNSQNHIRTYHSTSSSMYKIIFLIHKYSVSLFLLLYVAKTVLLLINKKELLERLTKLTKVPEMIVSALFLLSGVYMVFGYPFVGPIFFIKLALVFLSIPIAIVGFKKQNKYMAAASLLFILGAYGLAEVNKNSLNKEFKRNPTEAVNQPSIDGKVLYQKACAMCHGSNGDAGIAGAANLRISVLSAEEQKAIVKTGKNSMPKFSNLSDEEINAVIAYTATLK